MATLKLNSVHHREDRIGGATERYSLCYVLGGDCHYETFARMPDVQKRVPALLSGGASELSLLTPDGAEISSHSGLLRLVRGAPAKAAALR